MSTIPSHLARVPNMLSAQVMFGSLSRATRDLLEMQVQLSSGLRINRPSDDTIGTATVSVLDDAIERREQRLRNLSHADSVLANVEVGLADLSSMLIEVKGIASSQIGLGSDEETRSSQARIIDEMLSEAISIANRQYQDLHLFGGDVTGKPPIVGLHGGLRYQGAGDGFETDLGRTRPLPITVSGETAFGALSARVEGDRDLDPVMVGSTRLSELGGARGRGVSLGSINVDVTPPGVDLTVDLSDAHTVQDVIDTLQTEIQTVDPGATVAIDAATGNRFEITPGAGVTITITDLSADATAADLGLDATFGPGPGTGADLDPRITELTDLALLNGLTIPLGSIRLTNAGQTRDVDLSGAQTVQDLMNIVHALDIGIRVEIGDDGDRLDFHNELSGGAMSIADLGAPATATELGVRTLTGTTRLEDFNDCLGVQILSGNVDPITGLPDPARDMDLRITDGDGTTFDVDFAGAETVQDILDAINAATGGVTVTADLVTTGNGIRLTDTSGGAGTLTVERLNGSFAAEDLGILGSGTPAEIAGEDRARVRVESLFSHLIALRDALDTNDDRGIALAGEKIDADIGLVTQARAEVGVRGRRVSAAVLRQEDLQIQDLSLKSQIQDLDFTEAAVRFSLLQQQLQAGLATASQVTRLSLLDFIG